MECRAIETQDYVYGFLEPESRDRFEAHAAACARCRSAVERLGKERELLATAVATAPAPRSLRPVLWAAAALLLLAGVTAWALTVRWPSWRRGEAPTLVPGVDPSVPVTALSAIQATRSQKSYRAKFETAVQTPTGTLTIEGESVWVSPGVLYVECAGSAGDRKRIVRVGERVWMHHEGPDGWRTSEECGMPRAGRGFENADELLAVLERAVPAGSRSLRHSLPAQELSGLFFPSDPGVGGVASVAFTLAGPRLSTITLSAAAFSGKVWFERYNAEESLTFSAAGKPVLIPEAIRKEIRAFRGKDR